MPQKETLDRAAYTCMLVSYQRLPPQFQFSLSGVTLVYCISMVCLVPAGLFCQNTGSVSARCVGAGRGGMAWVMMEINIVSAVCVSFELSCMRVCKLNRCA